jgi:hypothetical protein
VSAHWVQQCYSCKWWQVQTVLTGATRHYLVACYYAVSIHSV